jgi:hypothetical protein
MSLTLAPYGLSFFDYKGGKNKMSTTRYAIISGYAHSIGQGDPVQLGTAGWVTAYEPAPSPTNPNVSIFGYNTLGVAVSFSWVSSTGVSMNNQSYWPAGTQTLNGTPAYVQVADLVDNVYRIQCNSTLNLTANQVANFRNYNFSDCTTSSLPNPRTSQSTAVLNTLNSGVAAPNYWLSAKIVGLAPSSISGGPNHWTDPYPEVLVLINAHAYRPGTNGSN